MSRDGAGRTAGRQNRGVRRRFRDRGLYAAPSCQEYLPTRPKVHHTDKALLIMDWLDSGDTIDDPAERDAAKHLSALHKVTAADFGFECDTLIGPLV